MNLPEGNRSPWDSRDHETETHPVKGVSSRWFKTKADAESYKNHRNTCVRARRAGFPTTTDGLVAFRAYEKRGQKVLTHKQKINKMMYHLESGQMSFADFGKLVIDILENRR